MIDCQKLMGRPIVMVDSHEPPKDIALGSWRNERLLDLTQQRIVVTGASGFVGRHLVAALKSRGCERVLEVPRSADLRDPLLAANWIACWDVVFHLAARCGGIGANQQRPAEFASDNLQMGMNVIEACRKTDVKKLIMVGTLCSWPQDTPNAIEPEDLWRGKPEGTNAAYGVAKRTLIELGKAYHTQYGLNVVNVCPTNMYGAGDNFNPETSHVIPAMIRRFEEAKRNNLPSVTCWGTGRATRDFLHVSDAVEGLIRAAEVLDDPEPVLLGTGVGIRMGTLASMVAECVQYCGELKWDTSKPDGQPNRVVSTRSQQERLVFEPMVKLMDGLRETVAWWRTQCS